MIKTILVGELNHRGELSDPTVEVVNFISELCKEDEFHVDAIFVSKCKEILEDIELPEFINRTYAIQDNDDSRKSFNLCVNALKNIAEENKATWLFFPQSIDLSQIALKYSIKNGANILNGIDEWEKDSSGSDFIFKKSILNKLFYSTHKVSPRDILVGVIGKNIFKDLLIKKKKKYHLEHISSHAVNKEYIVKEVISPRYDEIDISESEIVVGGGRGLEKQEYFDQILELAQTLGAGYGGTRVAVDYKWIDHERQIGRTGKKISPFLYVAVGVSGSTHHTFGVKAKYIVSINKDKSAPIFSISDMKVCADAKRFLPILTSKIQEAIKSQ
ncbi:electron transfer flavoprotein alpha subunit [Geothermobacter ehrlichii]|uniref:Electron transfer flavoprotein alpha subunit n=1 Tax=Geothermobacter ehrlichii TaxID=213224 RepID=A0A5D3WJG5_9BACT|nr:electron transfer flavoprotein subunit alpha/FixB family protein [Geothermobacter ehrlichii]TYO98437.1 electron transfer flavoprotein alpha subunit [Geothermobacter ehrlichii]